MTIRRRIVYGYAVVLGLAIAGTTAGLITASRYQRRALDFRQAVTAERKLISDLQVHILQTRPVQQLWPYLSNPPRLQAEGRVLIGRVIDIQKTLSEHDIIHALIDDDHHIPIAYRTSSEPAAQESLYQIGSGGHPDSNEHRTIQQLLDSYELTVSRLLERTREWLTEIESLSTDTPNSLEATQQALLALEQSPEFLAFMELPTQLAQIMAQVEGQERAAEVALRRAAAIRTYIVLGSLLLSAAIAAVTAVYTSRALVQPIRAVTTIAHQVTETNNFDLRVPIDDKYEVGMLSNSLNQLIERVGQLLNQLGQKNTDLEAALRELKQKQLQLVQSEKMSLLGQLVAGVAHEINNPVNFIHGNLVYIRDYIDEVMAVLNLVEQRHPDALAQAGTTAEELSFIQNDLGKILNSMKMGSDRICQIVLSLRNFSRLDEAMCKTVNVHEGIDSSLMILQHRLKAQRSRPEITVTRNYGELPLVECYPGQLNQVIMNILTNAIEAIEERYLNVIHLEDSTTEPKITIRTAIRDLRWVEIVIRDTGIGITEAVGEKIFRPFFTTKPKGIGTGIGMSISHKIITEVHHGKLSFTSVPGIGTEFVVSIPTAQSGRIPDCSPIAA